MNATSNLEIIETSVEGKHTSYYVSRKNPKLPWPANSTIAIFVAGGVYKKFRVLSNGDPNVKIIQTK
jgi:hypothetical protein